MASDTAQPPRQVMHVWPGNGHEPNGTHWLGDDEQACPCDPTVMEWHADQGWMTVRPGSRQ